MAIIGIDLGTSNSAAAVLRGRHIARSVRGIVAAMMGRKYWGCDLRPDQIAANEAQARDITHRQGIPQRYLEQVMQKLVRALGSDNVESRLRTSDVSGAPKAPWLGMPIAEVSQLQRAFFIGSFLRKDQPVLAARVRGATKRGLKVTRLGASVEDWLMPIAASALVAPSAWVAELAGVAAAVAKAKGVAAPSDAKISSAAQAIADSLLSGEGKAVLDKDLPNNTYPQVLADLETALADREPRKYQYEYSAKKTSAAQTTNDIPQNNTSPVGTKQNKIPNPYKLQGI